jgi:hypothetical protein
MKQVINSQTITGQASNGIGQAGNSTTTAGKTLLPMAAKKRNANNYS